MISYDTLSISPSSSQSVASASHQAIPQLGRLYGIPAPARGPRPAAHDLLRPLAWPKLRSPLPLGAGIDVSPFGVGGGRRISEFLTDLAPDRVKISGRGSALGSIGPVRLANWKKRRAQSKSKSPRDDCREVVTILSINDTSCDTSHYPTHVECRDPTR